jgi:hypothetical protein
MMSELQGKGSSRPFLADAGLGPGNCAGIEETAGAASSFEALSPGRLRASSRDGGGVVNRPPSPLTMLLSRHTSRREVFALIGAASAWSLPLRAQPLPPRPLIGFLHSSSADLYTDRVRAFHDGLKETTPELG